MNRKVLALLLTGGAAVAGLQAEAAQKAGAAKTAAARPNVIFILADDLGYGDVTALNPHSQIPTPNLDRMRAEGIAFTNAHAGTSVSTPSRYCVVTGQYCWRSELKKGALDGYSAPIVKVPTFGDLLSHSGYRTAIIGKWHLGLDWTLKAGAAKSGESAPTPGQDAAKSGGETEAGDNTVDFAAPVKNGPWDKGFQYSYILPASLDMPPYVYIENGKVVDPRMRHLDGHGTLDAAGPDYGIFWRGGAASQSFDPMNTLDILTDKVLNYIDNSHNSEPFFIYFPMTGPHTPWTPAPQFKGRSGAGVYGDFVCTVDDVVGRVLKAVKEKGLDDNTLVIVTSDNGPIWYEADDAAWPLHHSSYIFRGAKFDIWDGGNRMPFIARWPAKIAAGTTSDQLVVFTDLVATLAEIAGAQLPATAEDSRSFYPALVGESDYPGRRLTAITTSMDGMFAYYNGDWKFIDGQNSGGRNKTKQTEPDAPGQLYNMRTDPGEKNNLYNENLGRVEQMKAELEAVKLSGKAAK